MKTQMKNGIQKGVRVKDRTWPIFHDDDTHTSEDKTSPYICVGTGVWGVGFTPREAISHAVSKGLSRQKDHWAIWENLVPHGRLRLVDGSGLTVVLPSDISDEDKNKINIKRAPELVYGLRNFIGNAVKFSKSKVEIILRSDEKVIEIKINDDGPGIPEDIITKIGEPYIKSRSKVLSPNSGLGLGTFLGKTLLERKNAKLLFRSNGELGGALVLISWSPKDFSNV